MSRRTALLVVDMQRDFCDDGPGEPSLACTSPHHPSCCAGLCNPFLPLCHLSTPYHPPPARPMALLPLRSAGAGRAVAVARNQPAHARRHPAPRL